MGEKEIPPSLQEAVESPVRGEGKKLMQLRKNLKTGKVEVFEYIIQNGVSRLLPRADREATPEDVAQFYEQEAKAKEDFSKAA